MRIRFCFLSVAVAAAAAWSVRGQEAPQTPSPPPADQPAAASPASHPSDQSVPGPPAAPKTADAEEAAIRSAVAAYAMAFDAGDAKAIAALWAPDGQFINDEGRPVRGREAIEKEYAGSFAAAPGVKIELSIESVAMVAPGTAIVQGVSAFGPAPYGPPPKNRFTATYVKQEGQWLLASVHSTPIERPSNNERLAPLAKLLLGKWVAQSEGGRVEMTCQWTLNENYLRRDYAVYVGEEAASTGVQMIGWDPVGQRIVSWLFDSDGGFERGVIKPDGEGWVVELTGVLRDGSQSFATNRIQPVDENTLTWQSTNRSLGGKKLPDTELVRVVRAVAGDGSSESASP